MRNRLASCLLAGALGLGLCAASAADDYVIIVNKDNANAVSPELVAKAYRGEAKSWPEGGNITPVALGDDNPTRIAFDKAVLGKTPSQSRALWAQLTFTGKAVPPKMADSDEDVVKAVSENKNALGYVSSKAKVDAVKVVK
jgi:ABC-type phosphate transport system substrate-binding protein